LRLVDGDGGLVFFGLAVEMRWLVIGLLVSVGALLFVAVAVARYVRRQRRRQQMETHDAGGEDRRGDV
jgi:uncharacterized membrane protein